MKILRIIFIGIFILMLPIFGFVFVREYTRSDRTLPIITVPEGVLEISVKSQEADLLTGLTAFDEKDGDLTSGIIIEGISSFASDGSCIVNYAVCDSDSHVATATRNVLYKDYTSPRFTLSESLCFASNKRKKVSSIIGAVDAIDGDISRDCIISSDDYDSSLTGTFTLNVMVTNDRDETVKCDLPLVVEERDSLAPEIVLSDYLIYVDKGTTPDYVSFVKTVTDAKGVEIENIEISAAEALSDEDNSVEEAEATIENGLIEIETDYKSDTEGVYSVHYRYTDEAGRTGHTILLIIVEGK